MRFPHEYRDELISELHEWLLLWKRRRHSRIRNRNAYLHTALWRRALTLVHQYRRRDERLVNLGSATDPPDSQFTALEHQQSSSPDPKQIWSAIHRRLGNADRHLLRQWRECQWNVSRLARRLGVHRNTIHRRLQRIRHTRCPVEIESASWLAAPVNQITRDKLAAIVQDPLAAAREVLRARVILGLLNGRTYAEITKELGASSSTIARCRRDFEQDGVGGLKGRHRGKRRSQARVRLQRLLRRTPARKRSSIRMLARQFGLGKSTVQWILKLRR